MLSSNVQISKQHMLCGQDPSRLQALGLPHAGTHAVLELRQAKTANKLQPGGLQALTGTHMLCRQGKRTM